MVYQIVLVDQPPDRDPGRNLAVEALLNRCRGHALGLDLAHAPAPGNNNANNIKNKNLLVMKSNVIT